MLEDKNWLVVSTHLKNISQNGNLPNRGENKKCLKPPPRKHSQASPLHLIHQSCPKLACMPLTTWKGGYARLQSSHGPRPQVLIPGGEKNASKHNLNDSRISHQAKHLRNTVHNIWCFSSHKPYEYHMKPWLALLLAFSKANSPIKKILFNHPTKTNQNQRAFKKKSPQKKNRSPTSGFVGPVNTHMTYISGIWGSYFSLGPPYLPRLL